MISKNPNANSIQLKIIHHTRNFMVSLNSLLVPTTLYCRSIGRTEHEIYYVHLFNEYANFYRTNQFWINQYPKINVIGHFKENDDGSFAIDVSEKQNHVIFFVKQNKISATEISKYVSRNFEGIKSNINSHSFFKPMKSNQVLGKNLHEVFKKIIEEKTNLSEEEIDEIFWGSFEKIDQERMKKELTLWRKKVEVINSFKKDFLSSKSEMRKELPIEKNSNEKLVLEDVIQFE